MDDSVLRRLPRKWPRNDRSLEGTTLGVSWICRLASCGRYESCRCRSGFGTYLFTRDLLVEDRQRRANVAFFHNAAAATTRVLIGIISTGARNNDLTHAVWVRACPLLPLNQSHHSPSGSRRVQVLQSRAVAVVRQPRSASLSLELSRSTVLRGSTAGPTCFALVHGFSSVRSTVEITVTVLTPYVELRMHEHL